MHTLGHPSRIDQLVDIANEFDLVLVEDAAESLGSYCGETHTGLFGSMGVFSFNGNKTMTTGGGGALVTNDPGLAAKAKHLSTTARVPHLWEFDHDAVGFNFRMPNINAALGVAQLEQTPGFIAGHRELFDHYAEAFSSSAHGVLKKERKGTHSNYWLQAFELSADDAGDRDDLMRACIAEDIQVRPLWKPLNSLSPYLSFPSAPTPVTEDLYSRVICLPSTPGIVKH
jgi:perosamine synthetase